MSAITKYYFTIILAASVLAGLGIILWAANKGFDLSDEGYYISGYNNQIESPFWLSAFHFLTIHTLSKWGSGIIYFRIVRLLFAISGSLFLSFAFFKWVQKHTPSHKNIFSTSFLICLSGTFVSYSYGPQTLSYNHYTLFLGNVFLGLLLLLLTYPESTKKKILIAGASGLVFGLEFFVKIPTAFSLFLVFIFIQVMWLRQSMLLILLNFALFIACSAAVFSAVCLPQSPWLVLNEYFGVFFSGTAFESHSIRHVLENYKTGLADLWDSHIINFVPLLAGSFFSLIAANQNKYLSIKNSAGYFYFLVSLLLLYKLCSTGYFISGFTYIGTVSIVYTLSLFYLAILLFFIFLNKPRKLKSIFFNKKLPVFLLLLFFPLICSLGSSNYLQLQILFFLNTWFLVIYWVYLFAKIEKSKLAFSISVILLIITTKSTLDVYWGLVLDPYRVRGPLWKQTEPLTIQSTNETIFIDKELSNSITAIQQVISKNTPTALFASSNLAGLGYILNTKMIGFGSYDCTVTSREFICRSYNTSALKEKKRVYFILNSENNKCNIFECMTDKQSTSKLIAFPWNNPAPDSVYVYERHD
jgi:hypothetical protein